jgi:hypothetical protein
MQRRLESRAIRMRLESFKSINRKAVLISRGEEQPHLGLE